MKNVMLSIALIAIIFLGSCTDNYYLDAEDQTQPQAASVTEKNGLVETDNPPSELTKGVKSFNIIYITSDNINNMSPWGMYLSDRYYDREKNKLIIAPCYYDVYKIKGRIYFGFYEGKIYISRSYGEYSIELGIINDIRKAAENKRYALCLKGVEQYYQSGLGLGIIKVQQ